MPLFQMSSRSPQHGEQAEESKASPKQKIGLAICVLGIIVCALSFYDMRIDGPNYAGGWAALAFALGAIAIGGGMFTAIFTGDDVKKAIKRPPGGM